MRIQNLGRKIFTLISLPALAIVLLGANGCPKCVTFEPPEVTLPADYGSDVGQTPGTTIFVQNGIEVSVHKFFWPTGGTFGDAYGRPATAAFGTGQFLWTNNINVGFDFSGLGYTPSKVTFAFEDLGGFENLAIDGAPWPPYVGELTAAPLPNFTTSPQVAIPGGYKSTGTVTGPVTKLLVGGQELAIDQVCAFR